MELTVDKFGRILIPKAVREILGLQAGDELRVELNGQGLLLFAPVKTDESRIKYTESGFPFLDVGKPMVKKFDTAAAIRADHEEYLEKKFGFPTTA